MTPTHHHKQEPWMKGYSDYLAGFQPRTMVESILWELASARAKFPTQNAFVTLAALTEEVGELNQAVLQSKYEPHKGKRFEHIYAEAVQVAAMAIRVALDCPDLHDAEELGQ